MSATCLFLSRKMDVERVLHINQIFNNIYRQPRNFRNIVNLLDICTDEILIEIICISFGDAIKKNSIKIKEVYITSI